MKQKLWSRFRNFHPDNLKAAPRTKIGNPKWVGILAIALTFIFGGVAVWAQQPKKVPLICYLGGTAANSAFNVIPFRERLRDLDYIEGQNITIEIRRHEGKIERLLEFAAELVRLKCDVIVTNGTDAALIAKKAIKTIPVVMGFSADAVALGIVASLSHPGGNITGLTDVEPAIAGKRLELLKETVAKLSRVAYLRSTTDALAEAESKEVELAAQFLRIAIQYLEVKKPDDFERALQTATKKRSQALMVSTGGFLAAHQKRIVELAEKSRLPTMYGNVQFVEAGGLMTYTADRKEQFRRAAEIVDMILKGTKPADIPVERPKKFDFVVNLKAAKQIGLTIPPEVLARATRIIK